MSKIVTIEANGIFVPSFGMQRLLARKAEFGDTQMALAVGLEPATVADAMLDLFGNASQSGWATPYAKLHTAIPGVAGTNAASAETTRKAITFGAAVNGTKSATGSPVAQWASWSAGTETITHISLWTASTAGSFLGSVALTASKVVNNTDTLNLTALTLSISTLASD